MESWIQGSEDLWVLLIVLQENVDLTILGKPVSQYLIVTLISVSIEDWAVKMWHFNKTKQCNVHLVAYRTSFQGVPSNYKPNINATSAALPQCPETVFSWWLWTGCWKCQKCQSVSWSLKWPDDKPCICNPLSVRSATPQRAARYSACILENIHNQLFEY